MKSLSTAAVVALALGCAAPTHAGDFDGSKHLLCAPSEVYQCAPSLDCERVQPEAIDVPRFVGVDFRKKALVGNNAAGEERSTPFQNLVERDGKTIVQGAENGRGWSMVIDQATGFMSASISDDRDGILLFGACTAR